VEPTDDDELELGPGSLWFLRVGALVFLLVLGWFLVDAVAG